MAIKTYTEQLEEVQAAITDVTMNGQSSRIGDRQFTAADLETLRQMESDLRAAVSRESRGGMRVRRGRFRTG